MTVTQPTALGGNIIHSTFAPFPVACFTLALLSDIAFWRTSHIMWQNFSAWLLFAGLIFGVLAALAAAFDLLFHPASRAYSPVWLHIVGNVAVLVLAFINSLVHAGDGWTAVVPYGLALSGLTVLLMIAVALGERWMLRRHADGVSHYE